MNSHLRLRRAAWVLRESVKATSWAPQCGSWWRPEGCPEAVAEADTDVALCHFPANADYIALMSPPVALALAEWLEDYAGWLSTFNDTERTSANCPALRVCDSLGVE